MVSPLCLRCKKAPEMFAHRFYECEANDDCDHIFVQRTQKYCKKALECIGKGNDLCFWLRGLVPAAWTATVAPPEPSEVISPCVWAVPARGARVTAQGRLQREDMRRMASICFVDGSTSSADRRTRRAGWGVAFLDSDNPAEAGMQEGWFGTIVGRQTSGSAELAAMYWAIELTTGDTTVVTDYDTIVKGFPGKCDEPAGPNRWWWHRIGMALRRRQGSIRIAKCCSHLDAQGLAMIKQNPLHTLGNELADQLAGEAARRAAEQLGAEEERIQAQDGFTLAIQRRLAVLSLEAYKAGGRELAERGAEVAHREPVVETVSRVRAAERASGHLMARGATRGDGGAGTAGRGRSHEARSMTGSSDRRAPARLQRRTCAAEPRCGSPRSRLGSCRSDRRGCTHRTACVCTVG